MSPTEKTGGAEIRPFHYQDLSNCVQNAHLMDLSYSGCFYTWFNKQDGTRIGSKIDRIMVNMEWIDQFVDSKADFLPHGISDHSPGVASIFEKRKHGPPPFRFFNFMTEEPDFLDLVRKVWTNKVRGNPLFVFMTKLRMVKAAIIEWKRLKFKNIFEQVMEAKTEMINVQQQVKASPLCPILVRKEKVVVQHYAKVARYEESMKKQRSRVQWLDLDDSNTHFFDNSLKERRSRNNILSLTSREGNVLVDDKEIALECISFLSDLYDEKGAVNTKVEDEIVAALSSIGSSKAPGPDGFSSHFFKVCWTIIRDDFVAAIQNVFKSSIILNEVNSTFITLVAKKENPSGIVDYRPIACCGVVYKCITKILSLRMKMLLKHLIHPCQSAFIAGRSIQDNIMVSHEIVRNYHRSSGSPRCTMKNDLKKAYDTVSWKDVSSTMRKMGFPDIFIDDVLVFSKGTSQVVTSLKRGIEIFGDCFGLQMNHQKTSLFASAIGDGTLHDILSIMDFQEEKLPVRLTLIKHVLSGMVFFWLSCFILPKRLIKDITSIFKIFLWDGCEMGKKHCPISWTTICLPYNEGGLGVRDVEYNNISANLRHLWYLISNKDSIWTDWVKQNLIKGKDIWSLDIPQDASWCWRRILDQRKIAKDMVFTILGDGADTSFLHAPTGYDVMINTDGSMTDNGAGFGAIIKDSLGDQLIAATGGSHPISVSAHEMQGVELGLKIALKIEAQRIHLCIDSMSTCLLLKNHDPKPPWDTIQIWRRVKMLLSKFASVKISHCYKESNRVAHHLAGLYPSSNYVKISVAEFTLDFKEILAADKVGKFFIRHRACFVFLVS
ncbi:uncharacterized protein LOC113360345 [Papaver somniferum]|uniref:uncharacterized protein LOC113360345 n=1 Tax=Papaver somniferum TaxID=3469 RepID=UPI000E6FA546|nr:uncharacterized protein LOC113360345 [Papaver somniferum]